MASQHAADLNDVITSAVNARVETAVLEALSGDEFFGRMVTAALHQVVEVKDDGGFRTRKTTFLRHTLETVTRDAVKSATARLVAQEAERIEEAVAAELRRSSDAIARQLVDSVANAAENPYGIAVSLKFPHRD
jgi:hypothetical protein